MLDRYDGLNVEDDVEEEEEEKEEEDVDPRREDGDTEVMTSRVEPEGPHEAMRLITG